LGHGDGGVDPTLFHSTTGSAITQEPVVECLYRGSEEMATRTARFYISFHAFVVNMEQRKPDNFHSLTKDLQSGQLPRPPDHIEKEKTLPRYISRKRFFLMLTI